MQDRLFKQVQQNRQLAAAILSAWRAAGGNPVARAQPLSYGEDQLRYFRRCWSGIYKATNCLNVEVDGTMNHTCATPLKTQVELIETAIRATIEYALAQPHRPQEIRGGGKP